MKRILLSKRTLVLAIVLALTAIIVFKIVPPRPNETVRVVNPPSIIASLPHWIAEERGFYKDANIEIKSISVSNSALMAEAIVNRDADVLPAVSLFDILANQKRPVDRPLVFSHSRMVNEPAFESIIVPTGSKLATLQDLAGKKIAVYPGATSQAAVKLFLSDNNVDTSSVVFRKLPSPEHIPALERGDVDAAHLYEPLRTEALNGNLCRVFVRAVYPSLNEPSGIGVSALSSRFAMERPEAVKRYLEVWDRSIIFIREHPDEAREILAKRMKLTPEVAAKATWVDATLYDELDQDVLDETILTIRRMGLLPADINFEQLNITYQK